MIPERGKSIWFSKMLCGLARAPFLGVNRLCKYIVNPNVGILIILLVMAFVCGTVYRYATKNEYSPKDVVEGHRVKQNWLAGFVFENRPMCFFCDWAQGIPQYFEDLKVRENAQRKCWMKNLRAAGSWSINRMFDFGAVSSSLRSGSVWEGVTACFLFLFTWLIGGGGLVGSIITTMKYLHDGGWRRWRWLLWNHTVILGWDENGVTVMREHIESNRLGKWAMPERFVVVTSQDVNDVERRLQTFFRSGRLIERWIRRCVIRYDIYKGEYDDSSELEMLHLNRAHAIYVLGEKTDFSHDARILMLSRSIGCEEEPTQQTNGVVKMELHLSSFGLFCQQQRACLEKSKKRKHDSQSTMDMRYLCNTIGKDKKIVEVVYRNFYDSWAKRLFANFKSTTEKGNNEYNLPIKNVFLKQMSSSTEHSTGRVHLVIIGFSEMGQALALQTAQVAHYDDVQVYITVFDDELREHEAAFRALFPRIDEIPDIHWTFMHDVQIGSVSFMDRMREFAKTKDQLTIAIACEDSAVGMKLAIPIQQKVLSVRDDIQETIAKPGRAASMMPPPCAETAVSSKPPYRRCDGGGGFAIASQILLRQDVVGRIMPKDEEAPFLNNGVVPIRVFGLRDGAGYNAWFRDVYAFESYCKINSLDLGNCDRCCDDCTKGCMARNEWVKLTPSQKIQYELPFDCIEEMRQQSSWQDGDKFGDAVKAILIAQCCLGDEECEIPNLGELKLGTVGSEDWDNPIVQPFKYLREIVNVHDS